MQLSEVGAPILFLFWLHRSCLLYTSSYPFDDPVGLVLNDEGKLIGLDLNRSLRDEHGEIYDIVAGTFLVVGLGPESFASLPPDMIQKYTEQFKRPELFASINGQIVSVPVEPENPLRTAEMTLEDGSMGSSTTAAVVRNWRKPRARRAGPAFHPGAAGGRKTGVCGTERPGQTCP